MMKKIISILCLLTIFMLGCNDVSVEKEEITPDSNNSIILEEETSKEDSIEEIAENNSIEQNDIEKSDEEHVAAEEQNENSVDKNKEESSEIDSDYRIIEVSPCDLSGYRESNVKVDIGYGDREYWAYTNEYGQLVKVEAKEIILQNDATEDVTTDGRYCKDEAKVPGVEDPDLDEGHVIADSLGGVSNAYNITPQNSILNRHGDQAYMEKVIRQAGGCTDFVAIITYPNTKTQIPNHYKFTYVLRGEKITDEFDNVNPDDVNKDIVNKKPNNSANKPNNVNKKPSDNLSTVSKGSSVWISETGTKYHNKPNCGKMNPNNATEMTKSKAESQGYSPCKRCY